MERPNRLETLAFPDYLGDLLERIVQRVVPVVVPVVRPPEDEVTQKRGDVLGDFVDVALRLTTSRSLRSRESRRVRPLLPLSPSVLSPKSLRVGVSVVFAPPVSSVTPVSLR
nr:hypothetical protein [Halogeometricum sp. S3BR5-2]